MEAEAPLPETDGGIYYEITSEHLSLFILGSTSTASLMRLSQDAEPYAHGAVAFLMAKSLLKCLEKNCCDPPAGLMSLNRSASKLSKFVPWILLNAEMYRKSGLLEGWNEATFGLLMAAAIPTSLAVVETEKRSFTGVVRLVNGINLVALSYLAVKQQNHWAAGMSVVCALDCFLSKKIARWIRLSESNTRNMLRSFLAGMVPFYFGSL